MPEITTSNIINIHLIFAVTFVKGAIQNWLAALRRIVFLTVVENLKIGSARSLIGSYNNNK